MSTGIHIILGGTHGLGAELAESLREHGHEVFVTGRSFKPEIHGNGLNIDLSNSTDLKLLIDTINAMGVIDGFYWIAGYGYTGDFTNQNGVLKMAQVNFANAVPIVQSVWQKLSKQANHSKLVIVSSTTGLKARSNEAVYAATKHAQVGFARSIGLEAERLSLPIQVSLFLPGGMQTPFWDTDRPQIYNEFLDPAKVAKEIYHDSSTQNKHYYERTIERGSL